MFKVHFVAALGFSLSMFSCGKLTTFSGGVPSNRKSEASRAAENKDPEKPQVVLAPAVEMKSCTTESGSPLAHDNKETRTVYEKATVGVGESCRSETQERRCDNGTLQPWSGSAFTFAGCEVPNAKACVDDSGKPVPHSQSEKRVVFEREIAPAGGSCVSGEQTRTCNDGKWEQWVGSTFEKTKCEVACVGSNGALIAHGGAESRTVYQAATVPAGSSCVSGIQNRQCNNGSFGGWSGSGFTQSRCRPEAPEALSFSLMASLLNSSCIVDLDGQAHCWGSNGGGALGAGKEYSELNSSSALLKVEGIPDKVVALGTTLSTCALTVSNEVYCWGSNATGNTSETFIYGTLGSGQEVTHSARAVKVMGLPANKTIRSLSRTINANINCAITSDDSVYCWGEDLYPNPARLSARRVDTLSNKQARRIVNGSHGNVGAVCLLREGGNIICNKPEAENKYSHLSNVKDFSGQIAGYYCVLKLDQRVECKGSIDASGAFVSGPLADIGLSQVAAIDVSSSGACALLSDGKLKCWGRNNFGQLGVGDTAYRSSPTSVVGLPARVTGFHAGHTAYATLADGSVFGWGWNVNGRLPGASTQNVTTPLKLFTP